MEKYCKKCGYKVNDGAKYCPSCGANLVDKPRNNNNTIPTNGNQQNSNRFVYKYNIGAIMALVGVGACFCALVSSIFRQAENSQNQFWSARDNAIITPGFDFFSLIEFIILAIIALIIIVAIVSRIRIKCKYIECPYCRKSTPFPCEFESSNCEVCGKKIIMRNGKPEKINEDNRGE